MSTKVRWSGWIALCIMYLAETTTTQPVEPVTNEEPEIDCYKSFRKIALKRILRAQLGFSLDKDVDGTRTALQDIVKQGCKPHLLNDAEEDRRFAPLKGGLWNQDIKQLTCTDLTVTLQQTGNHLEVEGILKAVLTGNPYDDLNVNVELVELMKSRQAPLADSVPHSIAIADPTAEAPSHTAFYSCMLLASHYTIEKDPENALKYAMQAALDDNVKGTPADGLARILLKRVSLLHALDNRTLARHPRPATSLNRMSDATGGWTYDGEMNDPVVDKQPTDAESSSSSNSSAETEGIDFWSAADALQNVEVFKQAYLTWNRPAILGKGLLDNWPAVQHWTMESLSAGVRSKLATSAQQTPYAEMLGEGHEEMSIKQFVETHMDRDHEVYKSKSQPWYIFQELPDPTSEHYNETESRMLTEDFVVPSVLQAPESWRKPKLGSPDVWLPLQHFFVGGKGSGSHLHAHVATFNALLYGRKHWFLIGPEYGMHDTYKEQLMPIQRFLEAGLPAFKERGIKVIEFIQQAGEIVFVPHNWMHAVYNLEDSVGISYQMGEETAETDWTLIRSPIVDMH